MVFFALPRICKDALTCFPPEGKWRKKTQILLRRCAGEERAYALSSAAHQTDQCIKIFRDCQAGVDKQQCIPLAHTQSTSSRAHSVSSG